MFRNLVPWTARAVAPARQLYQGAARLNAFDELKAASSKNASTVFDIDELIANSPGLRDTAAKSSQYSFGNSARDARDLAKSISIYGPASGRSVDVKFQNVGAAIGNVQSILRTNSVKQQWNYQKRYIRPAKFQKEKKRKWWRRHFAKEFTELMHHISDAKRKGY